MNLFQIDEKLLSCVKLSDGNYVNTEDGEIIDAEAIEQLEMDRATKLRNIGCWIKNLKADVDAFKKQEDEFASRRKWAEKKIETLTNYVSAYLNGTSWKCTECEYKWKRSEVVEFHGDINTVPQGYLRIKEPELDKKKLKAALKDGIVIEGARLVEKNNLSVK